MLTADGKARAPSLGDEQGERIAEDAKVDKALLAIFINGYALKGKNR